MSKNNLRDWTVMVYFSADNDLQDEAFNNLSQMVEIGGSDNVHVLAQIDGRKQIPTRRYFMRAPNDAVATRVPGATRVGSVDDLLKFVKWGSSKEHEAKNYLIVLWGHANGIFDDEDDVGTAKFKLGLTSNGKEAERFRKPSGRSTRKNDGPDNALTSFELKVAFERIQKELGQKVAILGMDACLMSMAEIAQQVSGSVGLMVASEEVIPEKSWPYDRILQNLVEAAKKAPVQPEELAKLIVDEYIDCYQGAEDPVTLSACRLERIDYLAGALDELGRALTDVLEDEELRKAVSKARRLTQMFLYREYVDLFDFCERLLETLDEKRFQVKSEPAFSSAEAAKRAAKGMMAVIGRNGGTTSNFVLHCGSTSGAGGLLDKAHGVSIYFPPLPSTYQDLDLSKHTHWNNFVHEYINSVFLKSKVEWRKNGWPKRKQSYEPATPVKAIPRTVVSASPDLPATDGKRARLLLPKGTRVEDVLSKFERKLKAQAFLVIEEPAEIRVPEGTELDMPRKGSVKASSGTSTKASSGTSTKASTGTSTKAIIRGADGEAKVMWLDVPMCTLKEAFSGGRQAGSRERIRELRNGTRIHPPKPGPGRKKEDIEPIIVINEVKFVVDAPEGEEEKPALKARAHAN